MNQRDYDYSVHDIDTIFDYVGKQTGHNLLYALPFVFAQLSKIRHVRHLLQEWDKEYLKQHTALKSEVDAARPRVHEILSRPGTADWYTKNVDEQGNWRLQLTTHRYTTGLSVLLNDRPYENHIASDRTEDREELHAVLDPLRAKYHQFMHDLEHGAAWGCLVHLRCTTEWIDAITKTSDEISIGQEAWRNRLTEILARWDYEAQIPRRLSQLRTHLQLALYGSARRLSLVQDYAFGAEAFGREKLRKRIEDSAKVKNNRIEAELTEDFAAYLFDRGCLPLLTPDVGNLRPDVFAHYHDTPLYVEAKQYKAASHKGCVKSVQKWLRQIDSTWNNLEREFKTLSEAYLLAYIVEGKLTLPQQVTLPNGRAVFLFTVHLDAKVLGSTGSAVQSVTLTESEILEGFAVPREDSE